MTSVEQQIDQAFTEYALRSSQVDNALEAFEPWDVPLRGPEILERAANDGVDLYAYEHITGRDPHPFQTGYMLSAANQRGLICGSRTGKSYVDLMDGLVMITGVIPISMRYPVGADTSVQRIVSKENVRRWGRRCVRTGVIIDYNELAIPDPQEWDCGNIMGLGLFPQEKISPPGEQFWLGTGAQHFLNFWEPRLWPGTKCMIPDRFIDRSKGDYGYNKTKKLIFFIGDRQLNIITYESRSEAYEAEEAWFVKFDEENPDEDAWAAAVSHAKFFSQAETPYRGLTYTKDYFFPKELPSNRAIFHAVATDSPYRDREKLDSDRQVWKPWEVVAREWGFHSEVRGVPYFDRMKINFWIQHLKEKHELYKLVPDATCDEARDVKPDTRIHFVPAEEDNGRTVWRIYERPRKHAGYVASFDIAEGDEDQAGEEAQDLQAVVIGRLPLPELKETKPVIAATLRTTLDTVSFALVGAYGLAAYNNALLAAETQRGYWNGIFASELRHYLYWAHMVAHSDKTGKARKKIGIDTNVKTRNIFFDLITKWIRSFKKEDDPLIYDEPLLKELNAAVLKKGRCDHLRDGTLDTAIAFGIFLYVTEHLPSQIRNNAVRPKGPPPFARWRNNKEKPTFIGAGAGGAANFIGQNLQPTR